jgi:hypothetical protein
VDETASALVASDASLEIGLAGSCCDLTRNDGGVFDAAKFGLKGSDDVLEGTLAGMLTVLNGKAIDHRSLLLVLVNSSGPPDISAKLVRVGMT